MAMSSLCRMEKGILQGVAWKGELTNAHALAPQAQGLSPAEISGSRLLSESDKGGEKVRGGANIPQDPSPKALFFGPPPPPPMTRSHLSTPCHVP